MMRRANDFYETASWQVRALVHHQPICGRILEPCVGDGSIARVLRTETNPQGIHPAIITNDRDASRQADFHMDAASDALYEAVTAQYGGVDWVVTNPPYAMPTCTQIVACAIRHARVGVAMNLRISFREPTAKVNPRGPFLAAHPIDRLLTMPRYSYTDNGQTDSATTEWAIWLKDGLLNRQPAILSLYRADVEFAEAR